MLSKIQADKQNIFASTRMLNFGLDGVGRCCRNERPLEFSRVFDAEIAETLISGSRCMI